MGYGHIHKVHQREVIATIPFGYAEGLPRNASGKITFWAGKRKLQQVGTICMNLCSCVSGGDDAIAIGTKVQLISNSPEDHHTLQALAQASDTIVYECLVRLDKGIRREII